MRERRLRLLLLASALPLLFTGCLARLREGEVARFVDEDESHERVATRIIDPVRKDARLSVLWIGHATVLLQMDDRFILTDPWFTENAGQVSHRLHPPGIDAASVPPLDAILVSHMHFDHLSFDSLELLEKKTPRLFVPEGGSVYIPSFAFETKELRTWQTWEKDGLRITAVPVAHIGWRYGIDQAWMTKSFTGYVIEYHGLTVYFSGDTAYAEDKFKSTAARFPHIDLALLPIAPIHPRSFMSRVHTDPDEALRAFADLGAKTMVPIHFDTLVNSADARGEARLTLADLVRQRGLADRVATLRIGEQRVIVPR